jgi:hypothetical protein
MILGKSNWRLFLPLVHVNYRDDANGEVNINYKGIDFVTDVSPLILSHFLSYLVIKKIRLFVTRKSSSLGTRTIHSGIE